jgi:two-component system CheB/CheR fusion protein
MVYSLDELKNGKQPARAGSNGAGARKRDASRDAVSEALRLQVRRLEAQVGALRAEAEAIIEGSDFRHVIDASPVPLSVDDMRGSIIYLNRKFQEKFGYSQEELPTSSAWFERAYPNPSYRSIVAKQWKALVERSLRGGKREIGPLDVEVTCKDGSLRRVEFVGTLMGRRLLLAANDITERERLENEILEISEQEQERIGQDLHDGVCQLLSGIKFKTTLLEQKLEAKATPEAEDARAIEAYLNTAIQQARNLAKGLHPVDLEARGLMSALQGLAATAAKLYDIKCECRFQNPVLMHDHVKATHFFRIAQEAINNAIRHGRATRIVIRLAGSGERLGMVIRDNGVGFSGTSRKRSGMGLHLMNYRARAMGASLVVRKSAGKGTIVSCVLRPSPIRRKERANVRGKAR